MKSTPHDVEQKKIRADTLVALHKIAPVEAPIWDHWIEIGQARVIEVPA